MADDSIKTRESTPPALVSDNGPNFGASSPEPRQASTEPNYQETNASQPQAEVPVVVQLRDKLTDLVQLLGSSGGTTATDPKPTKLSLKLRPTCV